jgi:hypothetical protein
MKVINLIDEINRSEWLVRFYDELLVPNFSQFPEELDTLDTFYYALNSKSDYTYTLHITLLIEDDNILAGCSYEYYPNISFSGSIKENNTLKQLIDCMQRIISTDYTAESVFLGDFNRWCERRIKNGEIKKISAVKPVCPKDYKKLY